MRRGHGICRHTNSFGSFGNMCVWFRLSGTPVLIMPLNDGTLRDAMVSILSQSNGLVNGRSTFSS